MWHLFQFIRCANRYCFWQWQYLIFFAVKLPLNWLLFFTISIIKIIKISENIHNYVFFLIYAKPTWRGSVCSWRDLFTTISQLGCVVNKINNRHVQNKFWGKNHFVRKLVWPHLVWMWHSKEAKKWLWNGPIRIRALKAHRERAGVFCACIRQQVIHSDFDKMIRFRSYFFG